MSDVTTLENAPLPPGLEFNDNDDSGTEMFYLSPKGNEIVVGRIGYEGAEKIKRVREGYKPLDAYGAFKVQPYHQDHPFEVLFVRGGAKDMPLQQVIDQGFYFRPPLIPRCGATFGETGHPPNRKTLRHTERCWQGATTVVFPQLTGSTVEEREGPYACKWCADETGEPKLFARQRGLRQHESVVHLDEIGSDRLGAQLIKGLGGGQAGPSNTEADLKGELLKMQEQMEALMAREMPVFTPAKTPYLCGICGDALPNGFKLASHIKAHETDKVPA
ncbi:MAG: hypothetical protein ACRESF_17710 [Pseudomonas sp.]